jgi:hypothetical protein
MLRRLLSFGLSALLVFSAVPPVSARVAASGEISGMALTSGGQYLSNYTARLRDLEAGTVQSTSTTNAAGAFSFTGLNAGMYIVELVSGASVVGTSAPVVLSERHMVAAGVEARAAAAQAQPAAVSGGSFWTSTLGIVVVAAVAAGVITAVVVAQDDTNPSATTTDASPSR